MPDKRRSIPTKTILGLVAVVLGLLSAGIVAADERRMALVIGNGGLANPPLKNAENDARLMAGTLRILGFEVLERLNADQKEMMRAIRDFGNLLEGGGGDVVGLFFFAGHGVQVNGRNYLIPTRAEIRSERDVRIEAVAADAVLSEMEFAGARLNLVILDACRNNPYTSEHRSSMQGLARMDAPRGTLVAYATSPGSVAADGRGTNSPYTLELVKAMRQPGISVERMFRRVRNKVMAATDENQIPWESSSLTGGDFFFNPATSATRREIPTSKQVEALQELVYWNTIRDSTTSSVFEDFLKEFPGGVFATLAEHRINVITRSGSRPSTTKSTRSRIERGSPPASADEEAWRAIRKMSSPVRLEAFIATYPKSRYVPVAQRKLNDLYDRAQRATTVTASASFEGAVASIEESIGVGKGHGRRPLFPRTEQEIVVALRVKDGRTVFQGVGYYSERGRIYKEIKGKRYRMRGLAGIIDAPIVPRVAAQVRFDLDSASIRAESFRLLDEFGKALNGDLSEATLMVAGHTDSLGSDTYNRDLSLRRAEAVKRFLIERHGISPERLQVKAYGEARPIASNNTEAGQALNRRIEFIRVK